MTISALSLVFKLFIATILVVSVPSLAIVMAVGAENFSDWIIVCLVVFAAPHYPVFREIPLVIRSEWYELQRSFKK